jgi:hypothetical protein
MDSIIVNMLTVGLASCILLPALTGLRNEAETP